MIHKSVLKNQVLEYLNPQTNENFIDCTIGAGGHTQSILDKTGPNGKVLGIDLDEDAINYLKEGKLNKRLILVNDSFINLKDIIQKKSFNGVSGILFDLGVSSDHLDTSGRGFTFQNDEVLDMRYKKEEGRLMAAEIINSYSQEDLEYILKEYGEERFARRIAKNIVEERKKERIITTQELVEVIKRSLPIWSQKTKIHPATRTFQALRITVNDELNAIAKALPQALEALEPGGRMVIISFHSLEDRIAKHFFRNRKNEGLITILTKKPIIATEEEIKQNPRSRSAKLRAIQKI
ncbi:MAG: 16S rRNA (cytosine(1402)-N(4))-methyltransferase RsmH [Patescibacteria group bacterium]